MQSRGWRLLGPPQGGSEGEGGTGGAGHKSAAAL